MLWIEYALHMTDNLFYLYKTLSCAWEGHYPHLPMTFNIVFKIVNSVKSEKDHGAMVVIFL